MQRRRRAVLVAGLAFPVAAFALATAWPSRHQARATRQAVQPATLLTTAGGHLPLPAVIRGVHVGIPAARDARYLRALFAAADPAHGLNAVEVDVKDERGAIGFLAGVPTLARRIGAARAAYDPRAVVSAARGAGLYTVGRIVMFVDPILAERRPLYAVKAGSGGVFRDKTGRAWVNPYNEAVWEYNLGVAKAAADAGFDEVQFDFVRFPGDGPYPGALQSARYAPRRNEPMTRTIVRFLQRATRILHPMHVQVSAALLGLAATKDLHVGQDPRQLRNLVDTISPTTFPAAYGRGQYAVPDPARDPGDTVAASLADWARALAGGTALLRPWLQAYDIGGVHYGRAQIVAQIKAANSLHVDGFMLWNPDSRYDAALLAAS